MNNYIIPGKPRRRRGRNIPVAQWTPLTPEDQAKYNAWLAEFNRLDEIRAHFASVQRFGCQGTSQIFMGDIFALTEGLIGLVPRQTMVVVVCYQIDSNQYIVVPQGPFKKPAGTGEYALGDGEGGEVYQVWNSFVLPATYFASRVHHIGTICDKQLADIGAMLDSIKHYRAMPPSETLHARIGPREQCTPQLMQYFNAERRTVI